MRARVLVRTGERNDKRTGSYMQAGDHHFVFVMYKHAAASHTGWFLQLPRMADHWSVSRAEKPGVASHLFVAVLFLTSSGD